MDKTIIQISHDQCTGCGACYNKCPVNAIEMRPDTEGFLFPSIHPDRCIQCGKCLQVCPVHGPAYENVAEPECYAVMGNDDIRGKSSSGGAFTLLANWMLDRGGAVIGAAYTDDCRGVEHILVDNKEDLRKLRGSKYVQSDTGTIYREMKARLEKGIPVLFTGTPCQIAAVNSYLGKPYDLLYTVDLVCHGVPSPGVYKAFVKELEEKHGSKVKKVSFRDKSVVSWDHSIKIDFEDGQTYARKRNDCPYLKAFLQLLSVRKSCGQCPFAKLPRQGDMTIADFWDIHRYKASFDDRKGTSLVLSNNQKGRQMLEVLRKNAILCSEAPLEHAVKYNSQIRHSSLLHPRRSRFFDLLSTYHYNFEKAVDYGMNRKFDIGYVGWWYGANYGSVMTNYALNRVLTDMGKTVLMLEWPVLSGKVPKTKPDNKTRRFVRHFYEQSMNTRLEDYGRFNYHCDTFLVGSDQLWNWWSNRDVGTYHFFLDFVDDKHKKIAYSTSFGHDSAYYPEEMKLKVNYLLQRFDAVSVRETSGVDVCKRDYDVDAVQTADPVFLCSEEAYEEAIAISEVAVKEPYVLGYILNPTPEKMESLRYVAKQMNLPYRVILDGQEDFGKLKAMANDPNVLENVEIADWLKYFKHASYVVTDSFHGFCYSIIFRHDMSVFPNKLRGLSRFESLCQTTGLADRMVYSKEELIEKAPWENHVDFEAVAQRMAPQIAFSRQWLKNALEMEKRFPNSRELILRQLMETRERLQLLEQQNKALVSLLNESKDLHTEQLRECLQALEEKKSQADPHEAREEPGTKGPLEKIRRFLSKP